jgi:hypothetical protein
MAKMCKMAKGQAELVIPLATYQHQTQYQNGNIRTPLLARENEKIKV